jgi:hypothetical protein
MDCVIEKIIHNPQEREAKIRAELRTDGFNFGDLLKLANQFPDYEPLQDMVSRIRHELKGKMGSRPEEKWLIPEFRDHAYSGLALTGAMSPLIRPNLREDVVDKLKHDHLALRKAVQAAKKWVYDPVEAPFNPQYQLIGGDREVSDVDALMVLTGQLFTLTNLAATTGGGMEARLAITYLKIPVVFVKERGITMELLGEQEFPSRLSTGSRRIIPLQYRDAEKEKDKITDAIHCVTQYPEIGIGHCKVHGNSVIGFENGKPRCIRGTLEDNFKQFRYDFSMYMSKASK